MMTSKGAHREGAGFRDTAPQNRNFQKTQISKTLRYQMFYGMYPAAEISHGNRLVISTLKFWKIK